MEITGKVSAQLLPNQPGGANGAPADPLPLLPGCNDLLAGGDAGAAIAALTVQMGREQKKSAMANRRNAEATESAEQGQQIQALRDKADLVRVQGFVDAAMTVGEGAMKFGSDMNTASSEGHKARGESADQERTGKEGARFGGAASGFKASGQIVDGMFKGAIIDKDTDHAVHEQLASRAKRAVDDAVGDYDDAKKLLEKALDFYKEYTGAKNGAVSAAIHRA
ncbi:hypothetical protein BH09MYX1_BH09MYX1_61160 [soil metagenome]